METHHVHDLGLQPVGFDGEDYIVELSIEARHLNVGGIVHGGVICSLLDTAMARSWFMREGNRELTAGTLEMKVNFLGSAKEGTLVARGHVVHVTRRTVMVEGRVDLGNRPVARATATMMRFEEGQTRQG
jgi:uncharacterized protein (TIGR00369 family)